MSTVIYHVTTIEMKFSILYIYFWPCSIQLYINSNFACIENLFCIMTWLSALHLKLEHWTSSTSLIEYLCESNILQSYPGFWIGISILCISHYKQIKTKTTKTRIHKRYALQCNILLITYDWNMIHENNQTFMKSRACACSELRPNAIHFPVRHQLVIYILYHLFAMVAGGPGTWLCIRIE